LPKTYVLCTESEFLPVAKIAEAKISDGGVSESRRTLELPSGHVPMANMPGRAAEILLGI
jgi:hypothetical protein